MDATVVFPSEGKHVIEVVGDSDERLRPVVQGGGDRMEQEMSLGCRTDDVAVAVGAVPQHRAGDVRAVAVKVLCIVAARAKAVVAAFRR